MLTDLDINQLVVTAATLIAAVIGGVFLWRERASSGTKQITEAAVALSTRDVTRLDELEKRYDAQVARNEECQQRTNEMAREINQQQMRMDRQVAELESALAEIDALKAQVDALNTS